MAQTSRTSKHFKVRDRTLRLFSSWSPPQYHHQGFFFVCFLSFLIVRYSWGKKTPIGLVHLKDLSQSKWPQPKKNIVNASNSSISPQSQHSDPPRDFCGKSLLFFIVVPVKHAFWALGFSLGQFGNFIQVESSGVQQYEPLYLVSLT